MISTTPSTPSASATDSIGWWRHQRPDGCLLDRDHGTGACNMYEHGIAAFALADACEMAASLQRDPFDPYRQATQKAVQFIHYAQHGDGGWRYTEDRDGPSDVSVSGWQVLAMKTARRADISEVSEDCITRMEGFFKVAKTAPRAGRFTSRATTCPAMPRPRSACSCTSSYSNSPTRRWSPAGPSTWPTRRNRRSRTAASSRRQENGDLPRRRAILYVL